MYSHERNWGCRILEWTYRGLRALTLENEIIRVSLLVDKGSDIFEFLHKPTDTDFMWRSPQGVRNPAHFVPTIPGPGGAFLDYYEGGWQECFPSGGQPTTHAGIAFGAHGEVCLIPWQYTIVEDSPERVQVKLWVRTYRTPFLLEKWLTLERFSAVLSFRERVVNEGGGPQSFVWGHHPAFGPPFLDDSCVIDIPGATIEVWDTGVLSRYQPGQGYTWPYAPGRQGGSVDMSRIPSAEVGADDMAFLTDLSAGWYAITNTRRQVGFGMVWPLDVFRALWYWQVFGGGTGAPWFGRVYVVALEPWTTPQPTVTAAIEHGDEHTLGPGEGLTVEFKAVAYAGVQRVMALEPDGRVISP